jgi:DNA-binding response OmpR family regulator
VKILIIEDNEKLAKTLKNAFYKAGFSADYLTSGEKGKNRLAVNHKDYDLVVLDLELPDKNGFEICKEVREKSISTPILVLTGRNNTEDKINLLDLGADDYMTKPFSLEELLARIRAVLRRPKNSLPRELKTADLILNPSTKKVYKKDRQIALTLTEFKILEYMMRKPEQVITRDQLLDNLWGFDFDSFSNVIDVHIKSLRKKIGKGPKKIIETVRGAGYRISK